jgi:hypothetical protein
MRRKGPQTGVPVRFRCASCDTWIATFYDYPPGSGEIYPRFDGHVKHLRRVSPDAVPFADAVFVFTCPRGSCQRAHLLRGEEIASLYVPAAARGAKGIALPDAAGE